MAIFTNPGLPPRQNNKDILQKDRYCHKCQNWKPERSHHCKTCKQCVLMMDHHCPWTLNCVGYKNFPHFIRFLLWIIISTSQLNWYFIQRIIFIWNHRFAINTTFHKSEFIALTILTPFNLFIWCTISLLILRCLNNQVLNGRTQIESWEMDRLESLFYRDKLLPIMIDQIWKFYPDEDNTTKRHEANKLIDRRQRRKISFDSIVNFPYDVNVIVNYTQSLGSIWLLLWPWGQPSGDGVHFIKNDIAQYEPNSSIEDILLSLPWPPDGGRKQINIETGIEESIEDGEFVIRKRNHVSNDKLHNNTITRTQWENQWGEQLGDFGVDIDEE